MSQDVSTTINCRFRLWPKSCELNVGMYVFILRKGIILYCAGVVCSLDCMRMCVCVYKHALYASIHKFVCSSNIIISIVHPLIHHRSMHACMHACMHASIHPSIHPCMHACMHACLHSFINSFVCSFVRSFIQEHLYISWQYILH